MVQAIGRTAVSIGMAGALALSGAVAITGAAALAPQGSGIVAQAQAKSLTSKGNWVVGNGKNKITAKATSTYGVKAGTWTVTNGYVSKGSSFSTPSKVKVKIKKNCKFYTVTDTMTGKEKRLKAKTAISKIKKGNYISALVTIKSKKATKIVFGAF